MKKKIAAMVLSALMVASLVGCSSKLSNDYVTVKKYKGLEVTEVTAEKVTDEMVESTIDTSLTQTATSEDVTDRAAQKGDTVNIDYKGTMDGAEVENASAQGTSLELGANKFITANGDYQGFEDQIMGHKTGENFDITVQFPDEYSQNPDMAGKVVDFNITLNGITLVTTPKLTDDWVKANSEDSKTVEEYKKEVKKTLEEQSKTTADSTLQNEVLTALTDADNLEVKKYPDGEVDKQTESIVNYYTQMASAYGVEFKDFLSQYLNMDEDQFNKQAKSTAQDAIKRKEACELIAKEKKLEPSDKEYEAEIKKYAEQSGYTDVDEFKKNVDEDALKSSILQQKVAEYLADNCVQVEQKEEENTSNNTSK